MKMDQLEFSDIQGLLLSSYSSLPCAAYLMYEILDAGAASEWLQQILPCITNGTQRDKVSSFNIAFTAEGLSTLGVDQATLATFSFAFAEGMTPEYRSRILGDTDENRPAAWTWGGPTTQPIHVLLMLFGRDESTLASLVGGPEFAPAGVRLVIKLEAGRHPDQKEHFGYLDGVGQPVIEGSGNKKRQVNRTGHATEIKPGEFILGYGNEYGQPSESPSTRLDSRQVLPKNQRGDGDLGRNGSYLVFRHIQQRVAQFWNYLDNIARDVNDQPDPVRREFLGAKLVGRWKSGAPLVRTPNADDPKLSAANDFEYRRLDSHGLKCPIGAHIRRANPRNSLGSDEAEAVKSMRRHRLLRRGRSYGPRQADPMVDDGKDRGLFFIALSADIERQFEFVQQTWVNNPTFGGLHGEVDPLVGHKPTQFTLQAEPVRRRLLGLSAFVAIRGGAYFFLPGLKALRYLSSLL
jgi:Dyp-type peroxidase family